eukprot:1247365-Prymnesium_polylepis.2
MNTRVRTTGTRWPTWPTSPRGKQLTHSQIPIGPFCPFRPGATSVRPSVGRAPIRGHGGSAAYTM